MKNSIEIARYVAHSLFASYGIVFLSYISTILILSLLLRNPDDADKYLFGPYFAVPLILGLCCGYKLGARLPAWSRRLIWLPLFALIVYEIHVMSVYRYPTSTSFRQQLIDDFIGPHCGASECL